MKRTRFIFFVVAIVVVIIPVSTSYIIINKDRLIYEYMLYDYIEYNGNAYYMAEDQHFRPSDESEERGPVYLIYKTSKINYEKCNTAYVNTGYEGEEDEIFLFFDSARWVRK